MGTPLKKAIISKWLATSLRRVFLTSGLAVTLFASASNAYDPSPIAITNISIHAHERMGIMDKTEIVLNTFIAISVLLTITAIVLLINLLLAICNPTKSISQKAHSALLFFAYALFPIQSYFTVVAALSGFGDGSCVDRRPSTFWYHLFPIQLAAFALLFYLQYRASSLLKNWLF